ncbi:MAG: DUF4349 domain-containing protein [Pedobacter sp.]
MKKYLVLLLVSAAFLGCNREKSSFGETADNTSTSLESSDTILTEKIVKTADMRFRVKSVQQTKEKLSAAIKAEKGSVAQFTVQSNIQKSEKVRYSADSLVELTSYRTEGSITARVPSDKIDEFTNKVAKMAVFIDQQSMTMDDQSMAYLDNKLKNDNRVEAVEQLNKHANKKSNNVETALYLKDSYVDKKIQNMLIDSQVSYSTIILSFYQDNTLQKLVVENDRLEDFRPDFFNRLWLNLQNGWMIFMELILAVANLWMLVVLFALGYFTYKYYQRNKSLQQKAI